jgi:DNA-binding response OmpR family regulator
MKTIEDSRVKILLIEDDYLFCDMYGVKIKEAGFKLIWATSGEEGLRCMKEERPNLVLMDVVMPSGDGFDALDEMQKDASLKKIPVIMLTNLSSPEDKAESLRLGAKDYLIKAEYTPTQLLEKIKLHLG